MRIKNNIIVLSISVILNSCIGTETKQNNAAFVNVLCQNSKVESTKSSQEAFIILVRCNDDIFLTRLNLLNLTYEKYYKKEFLYCQYIANVIKEKNFISKELLEDISFGNKFSLDLQVESEYKLNGLEYLKNKYFESNIWRNSNEIYLKTGLEGNTQFTVLYLCFINNYFIVFDGDGFIASNTIQNLEI